MKIYFFNRPLEDNSFPIKFKYTSIVYIDNHCLISFRFGANVMAIYLKYLKITLKECKYSLKRYFRKTRNSIIYRWRMRFDKKPVYYTLFSRDCDMCESTSYGMSKTFKEHEDWLNDPDQWDWVEGATSVDIVSKEEYDEYHDMPVRTRDRVMEAYENGNGTSIYV